MTALRGGGELWNTDAAAEYLGLSSTGSARKTLHRLGVIPVAKEPGRKGQNLYDASQVRAAKASMPGRGRRTGTAGRIRGGVTQ